MNPITANLNYVQYSSMPKLPAFKSGKEGKSPYGFKEKAVIASTTALGAAASIAILAKASKYSLKPAKMFKNIKNSYLARVEFHDKEIISIGAGTCLGGLLGGYIIDKNKDNRRAKNREAVMQIGNISIPILAVEGGSKLTRNSKGWVRALVAAGCLCGGIYVANLIMNFISDKLFEDTTSRSMKATDFLAHPDDVVVAAQYISKSPIIHKFARVIPLALMIPGYEVGKKTA